MKKTTDNDVVISTMSKTHEETCINNSKQSLDDDYSIVCSNNSSKQIDDNFASNNCSYFEGILDTPDSTNYEQNYATLIHSTPQSLLENIIETTLITPIESKILKPSVTTKCLTELSTQARLTDNTINAFCLLLKNTFPNTICGLEDSILSQNHGFKKRNKKSDVVQVHYNGACHWVCSYCNRNGELFLYDSLYKGHTTQYLNKQLAQIYGADKKQISITVPRIQQQSVSSDCGLFALAVATSLAAGLDPVSQSWDQNLMRMHCHNCILSEKIAIFPGITKGKRTGKLPQPQHIILDM